MNARAGSLLLIDDEELNRDMLGRRLELEGFTVTLADSGRRGLQLLDSQAHDLVLLDMMMPEMSGLDVLSLIRKVRPASDLPVVMVTAKGRARTSSMPSKEAPTTTSPNQSTFLWPWPASKRSSAASGLFSSCTTISRRLRRRIRAPPCTRARRLLRLRPISCSNCLKVRTMPASMSGCMKRAASSAAATWALSSRRSIRPCAAPSL